MKYGIDQILNNENLIFDLKNDSTFKKVFLNSNNIKYLKKLLSLMFNIEMEEDFIMLNAELPSNKSNIKSSYCDLVLKYRNNEYIIEMNGSPYSDLTFYKNHHYLFKEHTSRNFKGNIYGKNNYTFLINIDNYNLLHKDKLIYKSNIKYDKYNNILYKNIETYSINLDYLKSKYYNKEELNEIEKLLIIFIEQRKDRILSITKNKYVMELIEYMDILKLEDRFIATYDREEYENALKEEFETKKHDFEIEKNKFEIDKNKLEDDKNKLEDDKNKLEDDKNKLEDDKNKLEDDKNKFENEKIELAKELKIMGLPINKIMNITKLSVEKIKLL